MRHVRVEWYHVAYYVSIASSLILIGVGITLVFNALGVTLAAWLMPLILVWLGACTLYLGEGRGW